MENLISKELLSEVIDEFVDAIKLDKNKIMYAFRVSSYGMTTHGYTHDEGSINIYELAHKCKEWAYNQSSRNIGYVIKTVHYKHTVTGGFVGIEESYIDNCKTEYELVFKLCQWILDNKELK